jgi:hypothetical protein
VQTIILDKPTRMTVKEANKKYYPNSYIMVNCEMDSNLIIGGDVYAYAPLRHDGSLTELKFNLSRGGRHGVVCSRYTKDPLDGGTAS